MLPVLLLADKMDELSPPSLDTASLTVIQINVDYLWQVRVCRTAVHRVRDHGEDQRVIGLVPISPRSKHNINCYAG